MDAFNDRHLMMGLFTVEMRSLTVKGWHLNDIVKEGFGTTNSIMAINFVNNRQMFFDKWALFDIIASSFVMFRSVMLRSMVQAILHCIVVEIG